MAVAKRAFKVVGMPFRCKVRLSYEVSTSAKVAGTLTLYSFDNSGTSNWN